MWLKGYYFDFRVQTEIVDWRFARFFIAVLFDFFLQYRLLGFLKCFWFWALLSRGSSILLVNLNLFFGKLMKNRTVSSSWEWFHCRFYFDEGFVELNFNGGNRIGVSRWVAVDVLESWKFLLGIECSLVVDLFLRHFGFYEHHFHFIERIFVSLDPIWARGILKGDWLKTFILGVIWFCDCF